MASSYSTDLKLELMVTGENAGTWGDKTNTNLNLLQQAIAGFESVTITDSATTTLTMSDAALSNARNMVIKIATVTLTGATTLALPDGIEKFYILDATAVTAPTNLTFKTTSGTGFTLDAAKIYAAYSDGTNITEVSLDTLGGTIGSAQIADNAVTTAKISNANVTTAKIADNAITTAKISALQVTSAKIANDAVGPDQLADTAVSAGDYTAANITVDAQGRLTAASSGAGAANMSMTFSAKGPSSGNYTSNPAATKLHVYGAGGGGGGGGCNRQQGSNPSGQAGESYFFIEVPVTGGTTYAYSVGTGGSGGQGRVAPDSQPGTAGNATNLTGLFAVNGGGAGRGNYSQPAGADGTVTINAPSGNSRAIQVVSSFAGFEAGLGGAPGNPRGVPSNLPGNPGQAGGVGYLAIFENIG